MAECTLLGDKSMESIHSSLPFLSFDLYDVMENLYVVLFIIVPRRLVLSTDGIHSNPGIFHQ